MFTVLIVESSLAQKEPIAAQHKKHISNKYSEEKALSCIEDYYLFYNADYTYRNPEVRRVSNNVFYISLQECTNKKEFTTNEFFWRSKVLILTIHSTTKYDVKEKGF